MAEQTHVVGMNTLDPISMPVLRHPLWSALLIRVWAYIGGRIGEGEVVAGIEVGVAGRQSS